MPYTPEHKRDTHQKILESARRLFNRKGFSEVSIDEVMENSGLTHGGPLPLQRRAQALATQATPCSDGEKATRPACH
jgi:hypothetical protein